MPQQDACIGRYRTKTHALSRGLAANDRLGDLALGHAPLHGLLLDIGVRLGLGHGAALDEQAFCAVHCADILDALLQSACDSPEDRERVAAWKDAALESLPEAFRENTFTEDPYNDPICEIILVSTGVISSLWNDDMKNCVYYVPIPEVAAYYMHLDRYRSAS